MKQILYTAALLGMIGMTSCSNAGNKVEAEEAKTVTTDTSAEVMSYAQVAEQSTVEWRAAHFGGAEPRFGTVKVKSAELSVKGDELVNAKVVMDMGSITVDNFPEGDENQAKLKGHLESPDFFNIAEHPTARFELTGIAAATGDYNSTVTGNLDIMGVSKSISFQADVTVSDQSIKVSSEDFAIDRRDWNLTYNVEGSEGVPIDYIIANDMGFTLDIQVSR